MGTYESSVSTWLVRLLTEEAWGCTGKDIWDVGAYHGYVSLLCAKYGQGRVVSFEPSNKNLKQFSVHLQGNPDLALQITIVPAAVSDVDGEVQLLVRDAGSENQIVSRSVQLWEDRTGNVPSTLVKTIRLDSLLEQGQPGPGLLKIDIEGAEALALAGASRVLRDCHPMVVLEVHNEEANLASVALLRQAGYTVRRIAGDRLMQLTSQPISYGHLLAVDTGVAATHSFRYRDNRQTARLRGSVSR